MAPGRHEHDAGHRRFSVTSSEDAPVSGASVPFEELLARELRKSEGNGAKSEVLTTGKSTKKTFLKKGARGWWMRQPGAQLKVVKHTLESRGKEEENTAIKTIQVMQRRQPQQQQEQRRRRRSSSASSSKTLSPVATPPQQMKRTPIPSQTLSPPESPIRRMQYNNNQNDNDDDENRHQKEEFAMWKNASFRSTTSTDIMGMKNVRRSYEAKQEREANEMAEFEAIERDLAAEKEAYLMEKQQEQQYLPSATSRVGQRDQVHDNQTDDNHWGLPYSSFVSDFHEQEQSRWQTTRSGSIFDESLDDEADSALVFDGHSALSKDDWMSERDGCTNQIRDHFGYGANYGDPPSDLSAVSFDDSVPWDDGLSFQPQQSVAPDQPSNVGASSHDDDNADALGYNKLGISDRMPEDDAPVSSLVQHVFGEYEQENNSVLPTYEEDMNSIDTGGDSSNINTSPSMPSPPPPPPVQDRSLSTLKQKMRGKQKPPAARASTNKAIGDSKRAGQVTAKNLVASRTLAKKKQGASTGKQSQPRNRAAQPADSGMILPAVIEEKLYELEEEVKFYKSETLQLQKRKDYYDQVVKKLALERDEFARYQQQQRVLIEKEWEQERAKMKREERLQDRQWKLRMNATISHQDRKDRGEVEMLKAQIVKMQLDEKSRASKWKAGNDNLRQRVLELEEKNRELNDEIKFLEKDRLEQWEKYEYLLQERQEASKARVTSTTPSALTENSELRTMDDVVAIKGTADELLQRWSSPRGENPPNVDAENDHAFLASSGLHRHVDSTAVDGYNPKRYSLDHSSSEPEALKDGIGPDNASANGFGSDAEHTPASSGDATYEWALPDAEDDGDLHKCDYSDRRSVDGEANCATSTPTSALSEHKRASRQIEHPGGKKETLYTDGSRKIIFPDGNEKEIDANGHVVIKFMNGDHKELFPDTGISVYYYHEAQTKLTTYPDNRKVYEFPNQQVETSLPDGTTEIQFADGIKKTIRPNGDEFSVFPDGTTMLEQPDGLREVTLLNQKKLRYFPDGQMACVTSSGQETRVRSDSELKQLMETT